MPSRKKTVADLADADLKGKKVLVRADLNVPLDVSSFVTLSDITCVNLRDASEIAKRRNLLDLVLTHEEHAHQQRRVRSKHNVSIQFLSPGLNRYKLALTGQVDLVDGWFIRIANK